MPSFVAWLRGINVGKAGSGRKSVPMAELRSLAQDLGWQNPRTHVQTGNLVFTAKGTANQLADALEAAILKHFDFAIPVVVSTAQALRQAAAEMPFADEADDRPQLVHLGFCRRRPKATTLGALEPYCRAGERCQIAAGHLWIDSPNGVGRSKLTPALLDRVMDAPITMRNVKTLRAVLTLLDD